MNPEPLTQLSPQKLARFLSSDFPEPWGEADGPAALRHQLEAPIFPDVAVSPDLNRADMEAFMKIYDGPKSFGQQLLAEHPSLRLLEAIKLFAKHSGQEVASPLKGTGATVLYFAAIAAALLRCKQRISQLPDEELRKGFQWSKHQTGGESLIPLFTKALIAM